MTDFKKWLEPEFIKIKFLELWKNNSGFLMAVAAILVVRSIIVDQYHVPSGSMIPTIQIGDRLVVNKLAYQLRVPFTSYIITRLNDPQRGDVVVFDHPNYKSVSVTDGPAKGRGALLMGDTVYIGLSQSDVLEITPRTDLKTVFAEITYKDGVGTITQKDSQTKMTVNGKDAASATIKNNTKVVLGEHTLRFDINSEDKVMVKRLVGLPGDKMTVMNGKIFINDEPTTIGVLANPAQPFLVFMRERMGEHTIVIQRHPERARSEFFEFTVPNDCYFFMGDNRDDSADSRYWGFVPRLLIKGKALNVTFSLDGFSPRWSRFGQGLYKELSAETIPN